MAGSKYKELKRRHGAPEVGSAEAEAFVASLAGQVADAETRVAEDFVSRDEMQEFASRSGLNALTAQVRKEVGDDRIYTKKSEPPKPKAKKKKKRVRVAI
jgi:hypothetical protein